MIRKHRVAPILLILAACLFLLLIAGAPANAQEIVDSAATTETYTISGVVREFDGSPVAFVSVRTDLNDPAYVSAVTNVSGVYTLTIPTAGVYHIRANRYATGLNPAEQVVTVPPGQTNVDFTFPQRFTVRGTVRDHTGAPVQNASVRTASTDPVSTNAATDTAGAYTLTVKTGTYAVTIYKDGMIAPPARQAAVSDNLDMVDFAFLQPYTVSGVVRDDAGTPIEGAFVWGGVTSVTSAADGSYTVLVGVGEHLLRAAKSGYEADSDLLVAAPPAATGVDIILHRQDRLIHGRVTDGAGLPVEDITVWADNLLSSRIGFDLTRTDAAGAYSMTVPAGVYWGDTSASDGYASVPPEEVDLRTNLSAQVDFAVEARAYSIQGVVRDTNGQPVPDATVSADFCDLFLQTETDATGAYTLPVSAGVFDLSARKDGYTSSGRRTLSVPPSASGVDLALAPAPEPNLRIIGRVTDDLNQPLTGVHVWTNGASGSDDSFTGADGVYTLTVVAGQYTVTAFESYYALPQPQIVTVPPDQTNVNFVLSPLSRAHTIQGHVLDQDGRPANSATVNFFIPGIPDIVESRRVYYDGSYSITVPAGTYRMAVVGTGYLPTEPVTVTVPPDATGIDFTIRQVDQIVTGRVFDQVGAPLCDALIDAEGSHDEDIDLSSRNGRYALRLARGDYTVTVRKTGFERPPARAISLPPSLLGSDWVLSPASPQPEGENIYLPLILKQHGSR
jgi:protocatechuate 3,4-dioxygenase beta subunit